MSGTFVAVVGPSGVGKDSLIAYARDRLAQSDGVVFVRRVVTRDADGGSEDHDSMDAAAFAEAEDAGAFALNWDAHGLRYGLPITLERDLAAGRVVVANLSRGVIPALVDRYANALVVLVTADRDIIERRLASRGRETAESIKGRLGRRVTDALPASTVTIDNSGALDIAGAQFLRLLEDAASLAERA
jgi:ribose 1,5-bisphosphokinase